MTTHDSALNALTAAVSSTDLPLAMNLAEILTDAIQELIEAELTARIGAEPNERTMSRTNLRNGHRDKLVSTPASDINVGIPKLRKGSFFPELLEPRRRIDKALWAVIMTAYITGTSTRKVDDLVKALGCDTGISKSSVSRICTNIDADVTVLRNRDLSHQRFVYVWLDATHVHVRERGQVTSKTAVIATGPITRLIAGSRMGPMRLRRRDYRAPRLGRYRAGLSGVEVRVGGPTEPDPEWQLEEIY